MVQSFGNQFLAGAALADHQNRPVERRRPARPLDRVEKGRGLADQLGIAIHSLYVPGGCCAGTHLLGYFATSWQVKNTNPTPSEGDFRRFSAISMNWHTPCSRKCIPVEWVG